MMLCSWDDDCKGNQRKGSFFFFFFEDFYIFENYNEDGRHEEEEHSMILKTSLHKSLTLTENLNEDAKK